MKNLIDLAKSHAGDTKTLPYVVVASRNEQFILNTPVIKPLLIFVLSGIKRLGKDGEIVCVGGSFLFLSNAPSIDMRNIPDGEYFAILIEFDHGDFDQFRNWSSGGKLRYFQGGISQALEQALAQFIELPNYAPPALWSYRKRELLRLLYLLGYEEVSNIVERPSLIHRIHDIILEDIQANWNMKSISSKLSVSEPTLRRKLKFEGASIKLVIDRAKLGYGLNLVQSTVYPIGKIADLCGFASQSKFTNKFKRLFGITPTDLRKTRLQS